MGEKRFRGGFTSLVMGGHMDTIGIYCRVSTSMQEDGYSLDLQEAEGIKYAEARGLAYKVYRDTESGASAKRLEKIKKDIESKKITMLWVIHNDRLTRLDPDIAFQFRNFLRLHGVKVIERNAPFDIDSMLVFGINSVVNADFRERLKVKVLDGKNAERDAGMHVYSSLFGYDPRILAETKKNGKVKREWIINPDKAKIVKLIFKYNTKEKLGLAEICKKLNGMGLKSERGLNFEPSAVRRILKHIEYAGKSKDTKGNIIDSRVYAPIIDLETWQAAQDSYAPTVTNNSKRGQHPNHAMTAIVKCAYCGTSYFYHYSHGWYTWKNDPTKKTLRTRLNYYHKNTTPCKNKNKTMLLEILDFIGLDVYRRAMTEQSADLLQGISKELKEKIQNDAALIESIKKEIEAKSKEIANFENAIALGLNISTAIKNINERKAAVDVLKNRIVDIEKQNEQEKKQAEAILAEFSLAKVQEYINASPQDRLFMMKKILVSATDKDGLLRFEFIDGRVCCADYSNYLAFLKKIKREADAAYSPDRLEQYKKEMAKLKKTYASEIMADEVAATLKKGHPDTVNKWLLNYFFVDYLIRKAESDSPKPF